MTQTLSARWLRTLDTQPILDDIFERPHQDTIRALQKVIGRVWQVFEVTRNGATWNILKSPQEIQDFLNKYNAEFKTKITLDRFNEEGVRALSANQELVKWGPLRAFLEFEDSQMGKIGSFVLLKKSGGRFKDYLCCRLPWQWQQRNFVLIKAGIFYYAQSTKEIKEYIPFGKSFRICYGTADTGFQYGIKLQASHRKLLLYTSECLVFCKFIYQVKQTLKQVESLESNLFESFAPERKLQQIQFLIDGEKYFGAVYDALQRAQWQIMICGWWISPEFRLKRPTDKYPDSRLDEVLQRAANRGVKIFILIYNESSFLTNDSAYTKQTLQLLSPNIKILRHPLGVLPTFWSHHEKVVIIDQSEVLLGGLDLCYGRYDTSQHLITHNHSTWYPGIEYNNIRNKDFMNVREFNKESIPREGARLPWHDLGVRFSGEAVFDVCHHFIEYWNYASFQTHYKDRYLLILEKDRPKQPLIKRIKNNISNKLESIKHLADQLKDKLFSKKEEQPEVKVLQPQPPEIRSEDTNLHSQHKMALEVQPDNNSNKLILESKLKNSSASPKSQQNNQDSDRTYYSKSSKSSKSNNDFKQQMLAYQSETTQHHFQAQNSMKTVSELDQIVQNMEDEIEKIGYINNMRFKGLSNLKKLSVISEEEEDASAGFTCQVLRSVGSWSIGCSSALRQQSIHNAYLSLISNSKHFIYIQNQFFVSAIQGCNVIKNQIANSLYHRILTAYYKKTPFKAYIVLPLIPGFAGELDDPEAVIPRVIMHWQYHTISRGPNSLLGRLKSAGVDPEDYIVFLSLRAHGLLQDTQRPVTEIVYLHSKLMIVDDVAAIIGSANINDRSMRGSRDSELCVLIKGNATAKATMNSKQVLVNKTIKNLREELWKQHFGSGLGCEDPVSSACLAAIRKRAKFNTIMYREAFHCYPDDEVTRLGKLCEWKGESCRAELYEQFGEVKGFVVEFPLQFLRDEDLLVGSTLYPDVLSV